MADEVVIKRNGGVKKDQNIKILLAKSLRVHDHEKKVCWFCKSWRRKGSSLNECRENNSYIKQNSPVWLRCYETGTIQKCFLNSQENVMLLCKSSLLLVLFGCIDPKHNACLYLKVSAAYFSFFKELRNLLVIDRLNCFVQYCEIILQVSALTNWSI